MGEGEEGEGVSVTRLTVSIVTKGYELHQRVWGSLGRTTFAPISLVDYAIWYNPRRYDLRVFGRYAEIYPQEGQLVYTQDDDCAVEIQQIVSAYEPGIVVCNMPLHRRAEYTDGTALVGWGAIFDRNLTSVFNLYLRHFPIDDLFLTECDRVFTGLNKVKMIDVPFVNLENAEGADRLHKRPDHWEKLREIRERIGFVKRKEGMA